MHILRRPMIIRLLVVLDVATIPVACSCCTFHVVFACYVQNVRYSACLADKRIQMCHFQRALPAKSWPCLGCLVDHVMSFAKGGRT